MTASGPQGDPDRHPFALRPHRTLVVLSVPVMLSMIAEPLTGLVDTAFVARLGAEAVAALGVATVLLSSLLWIFNFLGIGTQTEVAQALGARDADTARETAGLALAVSAAIGVVMALALWPVLGPLCGAMGAAGDVRAGAVVYLEIRLLGAPALLVTVAAFGALRGLHDMRTPLWIAVGTNAANAALCAVLVTGMGAIPSFGIAGAAWATVVAQWAGAGFAVAAIRKRLGLPSRVDWRRAGALLVVGRDLFLRTGLLVLFVALTTRAATRLGPEAGAAHQAIRQVWILSAFALDAFAATAQSLVGYFVGARQLARARQVAGVAVAWGTGVGAAIAAGMLVSGDAVAALLVPAEARLAFAAAWWIAAAAQPLSAVSFVTDGIHWGTRDYRYLRNAMALASAGAALLLVAGEASGRATLAAVWWITALWIAVRAALGAVRVWPGILRAPLARGAAAATGTVVR